MKGISIIERKRERERVREREREKERKREGGGRERDLGQESLEAKELECGPAYVSLNNSVTK